MNRTISLEFTIAGADLPGIAGKLSEHPAFQCSPPDEVSFGDGSDVTRPDWAAKLARTESRVTASWGDLAETFFGYTPPYIVSVRIPGFPADPDAVIDLVKGLPFELATFGVLHDSWFDTYTPPGFSGMQALLGWACAFRAAGHDDLVSRRWLEYGPWRLIRADGDISFVQFHDLAADAETALAQAGPGHELMGIGEAGGFLQKDYVYGSDVRGLYLADERKLVIAAAEPVSRLEMRDACAVRRRRRSDPVEPIERIAYMFLSEELARGHLHELWLRELECWALVDGQKVRLDEGYAPVPVKPGWVERLAP